MFKTILIAAPIVIAFVIVIFLLLSSKGGSTQGTNRLLLLTKILSWLLFISLMLLSMFAYIFYQILVVFVCTLVIIWLIRKLQSTDQTRTKAILRALIVLVILTGAFNASARFNFLLTAWARQRVVEQEIRAQPESGTSQSFLNNPKFLFLGRVTSYIEGNAVAVYFDYYKRPPFQYAFIIYTNDPSTIERRNASRLSRLGQNWYFLVRGYAD